MGYALGFLQHDHYTSEQNQDVVPVQRSRADRFENKNETLVVEREELNERIRDLKVPQC